MNTPPRQNYHIDKDYVRRLEPHLGSNYLSFQVVCPPNGAAVLKGFNTPPRRNYLVD